MSSRFGLNRPDTRLLLLGLVSTVLYGCISNLSQRFQLDGVVADRPLMVVLLLFGAAFVAYLLACCEAWQGTRNKDTTCDARKGRQDQWTSVCLIVGFGVLFRVVMIFSVPIQEIDLYRYIVDGAVGNASVSPYEFAPSELKQAVASVKNLRLASPRTDIAFARSSDEKQQLSRLAEQFASKPGLNACLNRVHYADYTSPYPPVSQAVFRIATSLVPESGTEQNWVMAMKSTLTVFDVLTGFLLIGLLRHCGLSSAISVCFWWCPLVIKEIANSGHLDSVAICMTVGFAWAATAAIWPHIHGKDSSHFFSAFAASTCAAIFLGLAVGAKVYPLVLAPIWIVFLIRRMGLAAMLPTLVFTIVSIALLWPIFKTTSLARDLELVEADQVLDENLVAAINRPDISPNAQVLRRPQAGIEVFSRYWEMNDLIFMVIVENVRPNQPTDGTEPWFLISSEKWRTDFATTMGEKLNLKPNEFAFSFTRMLTLLVFAVLTVMLCCFAWRADSTRDLLQLFFLSIAWFWLLSPTQNPWYWLWALPFLPFVKRPIPWLLMSGVLFLYYLRFHFQNHFPDQVIWPTSYKGQLFFDFVVPWIEFGPIFVMLTVGAIIAWWRNRKTNTLLSVKN